MGGYVHVLAAALGLAVLFSAVPVLFMALKVIGAGYLIWLGLRFILVRPEFSFPAGQDRQKAFWESALVEVLNPKTALFYVAFLPQFTDPAAALPVWTQLLVLGTVVNLLFSSADVICVLLADRIVQVFRTAPGEGILLRRLGGGLLVGLGLRMAFSDR